MFTPSGAEEFFTKKVHDKYFFSYYICKPVLQFHSMLLSPWVTHNLTQLKKQTVQYLNMQSTRGDRFPFQKLPEYCSVARFLALHVNMAQNVLKWRIYARSAACLEPTHKLSERRDGEAPWNSLETEGASPGSSEMPRQAGSTRA